jgi:hypothetical protein
MDNLKEQGITQYPVLFVTAINVNIQVGQNYTKETQTLLKCIITKIVSHCGSLTHTSKTFMW